MRKISLLNFIRYWDDVKIKVTLKENIYMFVWSKLRNGCIIKSKYKVKVDKEVLVDVITDVFCFNVLISFKQIGK